MIGWYLASSVLVGVYEMLEVMPMSVPVGGVLVELVVMLLDVSAFVLAAWSSATCTVIHSIRSDCLYS
jgi:hypothetical protein